jgi:hypothetical protein
MERRLRILVTFLLAVLTGNAQVQAAPSKCAESAPRVFSLSVATLQTLRREARDSQAATDPAIAQLRNEADAALKQEPLSVTEKSSTPPSGDKHDYLSLAPYWWPDPDKPNGLPYIRHDGKTNPEIEKVQDHKNFDKVIAKTHTLALAYYIFGDELYAEHATRLLRTWFLDPQRRMNPNLEFAQGIPGIKPGRGTGLIETRGLYRLVDAIGLLAGCKSWTAADQEGIEDWFAKFLDWMQNSQNGRDEAAAKNNHGTYYDVQVVSLALFVGKTKVAKEVLEAAREKRIALQIESDGRQPLELERTKALGYSTMNLAGLFELAQLGDCADVELWNFQTSDGRSIQKALAYLVPFVSGQEKWPYPQIVQYQVEEISPLLVVAAVKFKEPRYKDLALKIDPSIARKIEVLSLVGQTTP